MKGRSVQRGFTLTEALLAVFLLTLTVTATVGSYIFALRAERQTATLTELDYEARKLTEALRRDLWLTSRDLILLYPPGPGPYTAVGFPVVIQSGSSIILPDPQGKLPWNGTVIYHLWEQGDQREVRRTLFYPVTPISDEQRQAQLEQVVFDGHGGNALQGDRATTRVMVRNLIDWQVNVSAPFFDGYSETPGRRAVSFGSYLLEPGFHELTLRIVGRNSRSRGHSAGVDFFLVTPSRSFWEAEAMLPPEHLQGPGAYADLQLDGTWSANYRMLWPAAQIGNEITFRFESDRWEERVFRRTGARFDDTEVVWDTSRTPQEWAIRLVGNGRTWEATRQSRHPGVNPESSVLSDAAVRVLLRGNNLADGGWLDFNGTNVWVGFRAHDSDWLMLRVRRAFIAEANPAAPMDYIPGTEQVLSFGGNTNRTVRVSTETDLAPFRIDKDKSYLVSFLVQDWEGWPMGWAHEWRTPADVSTAPSTFIVRDGTVAILNDPYWSQRTDVIVSPHIYGVEYVRTGHAPEGYYTSQIFDTREENPEYLEFNWQADVPPQATLTMQIRAGQQPDLSDAPGWDAVPAASPGAPPAISGRYVQVRARLTPGIDGLTTPVLRSFAVRWRGTPQLVELGGMFTTGPDHGQVELLVDGARLLQGVTVDLTVYKDVRLGGTTRRFTSNVFAEMSPRNTGK